MDTNQNPFTSLSEPDATLFALYLRHHDSPESFASKANLPILQALIWLGQPIIEACLNYITKREHTLLTFDALQIRRGTLNASLDLTAQLRCSTPPLPPTPTPEPPKELQAIPPHTPPEGSQSDTQDVALHTHLAPQNNPQNSLQDHPLHISLNTTQDSPHDVPLPTPLTTPPHLSNPKIPTPYIPNPKAAREYRAHASLLLRTLATTARLLSSGFKLPVLSPLSPNSTLLTREPKAKHPTSSPTSTAPDAPPNSPTSPISPTPDFQLPSNIAPPGYVPRKPDRIVYGMEIYEASGPLPPGAPPRRKLIFPPSFDDPPSSESSP